MKKLLDKISALQFNSVFTRFLLLLIAFVVMLQPLNYIAIMATPYGTANAFLPLVLVAVLGFGLAYLFARYISSDINMMLKNLLAGLRAAEQGDKTDLIHIDRKDEFSKLADAINTLLDRDKAVLEANTDPLTGLANRRYLMQRLERLVSQGVPLSVMFIDLDGFKPINDDYGHDVGDEALKIVSERMGACIRESDVLCRLGGDEFVILFTGLSDPEVLKGRGDKVLEMVGTPMWIDGNRLRMGASIGIATYPKDGADAESVLNASDEAMYAAKQGGKNAYRFYS